MSGAASSSTPLDIFDRNIENGNRSLHFNYEISAVHVLAKTAARFFSVEEAFNFREDIDTINIILSHEPDKDSELYNQIKTALSVYENLNEQMRTVLTTLLTNFLSIKSFENKINSSVIDEIVSFVTSESNIQLLFTQSPFVEN
jgi:hypothetical protein